MSFVSPLGLLALLAVPAVIALHMFRRRFVERRVGGLFLFAPDALRAGAGRKRSRLLRSASLWLEVAAVVCAALWLAGLRIGISGDAPHLVIVLDDSASMSAEAGRTAGSASDGEDERSAAARARSLLRARVEALPSAATVTLIRSGRRPEIAAGPRAPKAALAAALDAWRPWRPRHDFGPSLGLARELAGEDGRCLLVTDGQATADVPDDFEQVAVGRAADNVAIVGGRRSRADSGIESVSVELRCYARRDLQTEVIVERREAGRVIELARAAVSLGADGAAQRWSLELPGDALLASEPLFVRVPEDALAADNVLTLFAASSRIVRVAIVEEAAEATAVTSGAGLAQNARLALGLGRVLRALPGVRVVDDLSEAHLVIGTDPDGRRHELGFAPLADGEERDAWVGPFWIDRRSPLTEGVTLDGVVWSAGRGEPIAGVPLVLAGDRPLITQRGRGERLQLMLDLDPLRSNFATSPDWPILLTNLTAAVRAVAPGLESSTVPVGGVLRWRPSLALEGDERRVRLRDPDGNLRPSRGVRVATWDVRRPGLHQVVGLSDDKERARAVVHFRDAHESNLLPCGEAEVAASAQDPTLRTARTANAPLTERRILAALLLFLVLLDLWVLRTPVRGVPATDARGGLTP